MSFNNIHIKKICHVDIYNIFNSKIYVSTKVTYFSDSISNHLILFQIVLNQLPLPSPLPATTTKSLLFNARIAEEVNCLLACRDDNLVSQLVHTLNQVSTDHM